MTAMLVALIFASLVGLVVAWRNASDKHPIFKLLKPHKIKET